MKLGVFKDFASDILADFPSLEPRFRRDLAAMNQIVTQRGLPPVVTMVLDQYPVLTGPTRELTRAAESAAQAAGMTVISTDGYYREYDGRSLNVSKLGGPPERRGARHLCPDVSLAHCRMLWHGRLPSTRNRGYAVTHQLGCLLANMGPELMPSSALDFQRLDTL